MNVRNIPMQKQRGSALITVLIFLIIMTLLGVSTMSTTRLGVRMATNSQFRVQAFQAAESGLSDFLAAVEDDRDIVSTQTTTTFEYYYQNDTSGSFTDTVSGAKYIEKATVAVDYVGDTVLKGGSGKGGSFAEGFSAKNFAYNHYEAVATGQSSAGGESQTVQGFFVIGPSITR